MIEGRFDELNRFVSELLVATGMPKQHALVSARAIVVADGLGRGSHGLLRLPFYLRRIAAGGISVDAEMEVRSDTGPVVAFSGNNGLGHWQAQMAGQVATERALTFGIGAVSVSDSNHCGVLGLYVQSMIDAGCIGLAFTDGPAVMPAWGGRRPLLSTSPIAAGIPSGPRPMIIDLATSTVARGRIAAMATSGTTLPDGWAFDHDGEPTTDPKEALLGMLAPMAGPKGFALALVVEALTGGMAGPVLSTSVADPLSKSPAELVKPQGIAHVLIAFKPDVFDPNGSSQARLDALAASIVESGGRLPGSGRMLASEVVSDTLVGVEPSVVDELCRIGGELGVLPPSTW